MTHLYIGDSVVVRSGVLDPDLGIDISGWQGKISDIYDDGLLLIAWDSITLQQMGLDLIIKCENENLDWELMALDRSDIEKSVARDSGTELDRIVRMLKTELINDPRLDPEE